MKRILLLVLLVFAGSLYAEAKKDLFHIKRNKNRNEVHYALKYDETSCKPVGEEPLYGYWRNLEIGPDATEPIGRFEKLAYGIKSQEVQGNDLVVRLKAFPDRLVKIIFSSAKGCKITPLIQIAGKLSVLKEISVFAIEGTFTPTVKHVDVIGTHGGAPITERINK